VTSSPAGNFIGALSHKLKTQSIAPEDGRNYRPKHVDLIENNNKLLMLRLVGYFYYCKSLLFYESCVTIENWRRFLPVRTKNVLFFWLTRSLVTNFVI